MATSSWPEVAGSALDRLSPTALDMGFWIILGVAAFVAWPHIRRALIIALEGAVHRGINGTAERMKNVETDMEDLLRRQGEVENTLAHMKGTLEGILGRSYQTRDGDTGALVARRKVPRT